MKIVHTMIRVGDLDQSITFYTQILGMKLISRQDFPGGKFTLAFVGYGEKDSSPTLELTHNWETNHYDLGNGYGHIALEVEEIYELCKAIEQKGGKVTRQPGPMKHGTTIIAFVTDPDGYQIELIQH